MKSGKSLFRGAIRPASSNNRPTSHRLERLVGLLLLAGLVIALGFIAYEQHQNPVSQAAQNGGVVVITPAQPAQPTTTVSRAGKPAVFTDGRPVRTVADLLAQLTNKYPAFAGYSVARIRVLVRGSPVQDATPATDLATATAVSVNFTDALGGKHFAGFSPAGDGYWTMDGVE